MKVKTPEIGGVAQSLQGRDKGAYYVIISVDGDRLALADGLKRKAATPKIKNIKHVRLLPLNAKDEGITFPADKSFDCRVAYYLKTKTFNSEN